jgi:tetratricopeptide (TPR) repeat protein
MMTGKRDDAKKTLQSGLAQAPNFEIAVMLAPILEEDGAYTEEMKMLQLVSAKQPDNANLRLMLGAAEMKAGQVEEGSKILIALLKDSSDASVLNDASYELADKNINLDLAEAGITKAVDLLTKDNATLTVDTDLKVAAAKGTMLAAAWDTLGWVYFREHKLDLAEDYLRAAWLSYPNTIVGLHLGQVQEAKGQIDHAFDTYEMAQTAGISYRRDGTSTSVVSTDQELSRRINLLRHKGTHDRFIGESSEKLQGLRKLPLGAAEGRSGTADYTVLMESGHVDAVKGGANNALHNGDEMVKRLVAQGWWPKNSNAKMQRRGYLNCHSEVCEFVMLPI